MKFKVGFSLPLAVCGLGALLVPGLAQAQTVNAQDVIYAAGTQSGVAASAGGMTPVAIGVTPGTYVTFSVTGDITLNSYGNTNDADGIDINSHNPAYVSSSYETGSGGISGITAPGGGYLVGVFLAPGGPGATAPTALDYTAGGNASESASSYSPLLDQTFFIGDGLTGDGTGTVQDFYVPAGASELYLGISDACFFEGSPSCYGDNAGSFTVNAVVTGGGPTPGATPEPSSLALLGTSVLGAAGVLRRRLRR